MDHLPHRIWELVNEHGQPEKPLGRALLSLTEPELERAIDGQSDEMKALGIGRQVIRAYHLVFMLYVEHEAITRTVLFLQSPELRQVLPETVNRKEAVFLAQRECNLTDEETELLYEILPNSNPTERCEAVTASWYKALPPRFRNG